MTKIRRIDFSPSEFIAGVSGQLTPVEFAVYWELCVYIYDKGESVLDDPAWLSRLFKKADPRSIRAAIDNLVSMGKIIRNRGRLSVSDTSVRHGRPPTADWKRLRAAAFARDGFRCVYCGEITDLECDHFVALANGGDNSIENLVTACERATDARGPLR